MMEGWTDGWKAPTEREQTQKEAGQAGLETLDAGSGFC